MRLAFATSQNGFLNPSASDFFFSLSSLHFTHAAECKQALLIGSGDPRQIVEALSAHTSGETVKLFFLEQNLFLYARQLLMLALIEDGGGSRSSRELARNLMEIMGNIKLNERSSREMHRLCGLLARRVIRSSDAEGNAARLFIGFRIFFSSMLTST